MIHGKLSSFIMFSLSVAICCTVSASSNYSFPVTPADKTDMDFYSEKMDISVNYKRTEKNSFITGYSVSENGSAACAYFNDIIEIYDPSDNFLEEIHFSLDGTYGMSWAGENIIIMPVRSNKKVIELNLGGEIVAVNNAAVNDDTEWDKIIKESTNFDNRNRYYLKKSDIFWSPIRVIELIKVYPDGTEKTVAKSRGTVPPLSLCYGLFIVVPIIIILTKTTKDRNDSLNK